MKFGSARLAGLAAMATLCLCLGTAVAKTKPPESASKVKKVLLYNKIGGWVAVEGVAAIKETFSKLAMAKGFELIQLASDSDITLDYLKQFQVIVWNNNNQGTASIPSPSARQAVIDFLHQGGGWILLHNAGDHSLTWPGLAEAMGTDFYRWGSMGRAEVELDGDGRSHRELKWMLEGFPETFPLEDKWLSFENTVRPLPGVTVVATSRGSPDIILPPPDKSGDNVYIWAREIGKGRLLYNAIGYGQVKLMEQQDSIVPRLYWENLRYAAGDYLNGCTTPGSPGFDPAARVHVEAMCLPASGLESQAPFDLKLSQGPMRVRIGSPGGAFRVLLRDLRGGLVRERAYPAGTSEIDLDGALRPGVYHIEIRGAAGNVRRRIVLP